MYTEAKDGVYTEAKTRVYTEAKDGVNAQDGVNAEAEAEAEDGVNAEAEAEADVKEPNPLICRRQLRYPIQHRLPAMPLPIPHTV